MRRLDFNVYNNRWFAIQSQEPKHGVRRDKIGHRSRAKKIYAEQLQSDLESRHKDRFVAIEPESGEYFLGDTFEEAVKAARLKHPSRLTHTIRIGHRAAFHLVYLRDCVQAGKKPTLRWG